MRLKKSGKYKSSGNDLQPVPPRSLNDGTILRSVFAAIHFEMLLVDVVANLFSLASAREHGSFIIPSTLLAVHSKKQIAQTN